MNNRHDLKGILKIIISVIFIIYLSLVISMQNRKYFIIEKIFKNVSSSINTYFINKAYKNDSSDIFINSKVKYLEKENKVLREEINFNKENKTYVLAEVTNNLNKYWFNTIMINKGYKEGIIKNNAVVNSNGLVGFVTKTAGNTSEVKLLTSIKKDSEVPVIIETDDKSIFGMLSEYDKKNNLFKITDVTDINNSLNKKEVYLSSYLNDTYKGIYVGKIVKEKVNNYGLTKSLWIKSNVDFNNLLFVNVVVKK